MGLLAVGISAASSVLSDQWRDYFYCDALPEDTLAVKGHRRANRKSKNHGDENIITNGSVIAVNEGQCMIIVEQGAIVECCAQAGEFLYDSSTEPSIFFGGLSNGVRDSFNTFRKRVAFGGDTANVALDCVRALTARGLRTCMGVSNISFGLPNREQVTAAFFSMALREGLSAAIMNPLSQPMMHVYYAARALLGADARCGDYIAYMQDQKPDRAAPAEAQSLSLAQAVVRGMKGAAAQAAGLALEDHAPMELVQSQIIPALDEVGRGFEEKRLYLPQLLMSAEAASAAFELIQAAIAKTNAQVKKQTIILATVKGDIHDIGKNIVKVLLQNYGYQILDLGRDVAPELVVQTAIDHKVRLVGLSALMTTTVPAMAETIALLRARCPGTAVMVGGAVLTAEYARRIGADYYAKDAMQSVRVAEAYFKEDPNAVSGT